MKIKTIVCIILCFSFFVSSCTKDGSEVELKEKSIAVEIDSLAYDAAQTIKKEVKEIRTFSTEDGAISAVETQNADLVVLDEFSLALYNSNERALKAVKVLPFTIEYSIYFHNSTELMQKFNVEILELLENGTINKIKEAYKTNGSYYTDITKLPDTAPTLTMAISVGGAPYADLTESGYVVGIDVDIANIIANSLGYNLEIVVTSVDEMFNMLSEDKVDFIISGLVYEPEREPTYNASLSYLSVEYYLVEVD